ncbi:tetratricopeptide repeat protein [Sediminispirochaeta smaragdinae]|jgi:tetratricopeptide (TPR) repeat protein|uniref:TPR repeat-containing protein n=1 Tax=Sediminispirochaeta smaragdinae (strain DSM 11293 / JCM 15392 / SEBR 4228) TaxID=573413 RepID=E1R5M7_SEDSS|nr:tetratricopeptide repeat protein [Sediminispirochaeta smaragdinae]ADK80642.1 TPR repeat-containing protein [Sediminispirochaeta smaragdinae DSM 11293]
MISKRGIRLLFIPLLMVAAVEFSSAQERPDALKLYRDGSYDQAVEVCKQELEATPENMDSYSVLCWSLLRSGKYDEALEWARKGMQVSRYDARMVEVMGEGYYYKGNNLDALKWFEEYVTIAPTGMRIDSVYYLMGEIFIRMGEYNHADIALTTAVYHTDSVARWWARLGYAREMAEDYRYALAAYNKALDLNSRLSDAVRGKERVETKLRG